VIEAIVVVVHEAGIGHLQTPGNLIRDLVHLALDALTVPL